MTTDPGGRPSDDAPARPSRQRVLVTGASSGIGRAVAEHLMARGHEVWGTSRRPERLASLSGLHPVTLDLTDKASIREAAEAVLADGGVDVLVNNAGSGWIGPMEQADEAELEAQFQILVLGPVQLTRALLPDLRGRHGLVVNVTSLGGQLPIPFMGPYSAAKAALGTLTDVWQMEIPPDEVAFVEIQPGDLRTAFNNDLHAERWHDDERYAESLGRAWAVMDHNVSNGPPPDVMAQAVERCIARRRHRHEQVGDFSQKVLGPLAARLLPRSWLLKVLRRYYGMG